LVALTSVSVSGVGAPRTHETAAAAPEFRTSRRETGGVAALSYNSPGWYRESIAGRAHRPVRGAMTTNTASQLGAGDNLVAPVRVGEVVAEKYLIERTLGVGGMGVVVAARDQVLDRRVAIKFLLPKLAGSDTSMQRLVREARAATRITSEHVVRLIEIEKLPSGTPFFVMEYLEGRDLRALLRESGALSPSLAVDYVLQAVQAVAEGHVKGIVHRDIKPGNLFLTARADGTPLIKVLDFGIAKTLESDAAESTALTSSDDVRLGSPAYMPPEQLQNPRDVDTRSDIWSLGATLYELLCARPPFEGPGYLELASRILREPPIPLSERDVPSTLPNGLEQVLRRCLEKDRGRRYANAGELAAALAPFGSDDARTSLARITGLLGSQSSIPALSRSVPTDPNVSTTTLEAPVDPVPPTSADERRTSNLGAIESTPPPRQGRSWFVLAAAAVIVAAVYVLRGTAPSAPGVAAPVRNVDAAAAAAPAPARVVAADPIAATPVTAPVSPPAIATSPVRAATPPTEAAASRPVAPPTKSTTTLPQSAGARTVEASAKLAVPAPTPPAAASAPSVAPPKPVEPAVATESPGLGRSAEIERLIEQRR
jgi:eukaryotic-like serine/threonine-protein kinase